VAAGIAGALIGGVLIAGAPAARAALVVGPADDRVKSVPTSWWAYNGVSAAQVSNFLSANSARITDLTVKTSNPLTFNVEMVANSGSYASGWWWYYGQTQAQVSSLLSSNGARLISAQRYLDSSNAVKYAVVMVPNTGANAKSWSWWVGTSAFINSKVAGNRILQLTPYAADGYVAILLANNGSDTTGWWYYYHVSPSQISTFVSNNNARIIDLSHNSDGTFNVVMYASPNPTWFWYYGYSHSALVQKALQLGTRLIDVTSYTSGSSTVFAGVLIDNLNALSRKLANILRPAIDSGNYGFFLRRANSSVYAGLQQSAPFEPASSLKVLYHLRTILSEQSGASADSNSIVYHYDPANPSNAGICPDNFANTSTTNLLNADTKMMQNSDNRMTRGILEKYGKPAMLSLASSIGMTNTAINHNIGCPTSTTHNRTTLSDLDRVYSNFAVGNQVTQATWRTQFVNRMLNDNNYSPWRTGFCPIVQQEAASLGKPSSTATSFCNAAEWYAKGGSYQYGGSLPWVISWSGMDVTRLPVKSSPTGPVTSFRDFVYGDYVDGTTINSTSEQNSIGTARNNAEHEALRPQIRSALLTW
jgi:hypothetical protein